MRLARHTLVTLDAKLRKSLPDLAVGGLLPPFREAAEAERVRACLAAVNLPGIVCRPTLKNRGRRIQLGLSFPFRNRDGVRVKSAILVPSSAIASAADPFAVAGDCGGLNGAVGAVVRALLACGRGLGVAVGLLGSAALEAATGLAYVTETSDVDVLVRGGFEDLKRFSDAAAGIARDSGVAVDVEVELGNGAGVKLAELVSTSQSLLAKSLGAVRLIDRAEVLGLLGPNPVVS